MTSKPYISLDETTFVRTIWMLEAQTFNVLGWMYRPKDEPWCIGYCFRYYADQKAFNSKDTKSGYDIALPPGEPPEDVLKQTENALSVALSQIVSFEKSLRKTATLNRLDCNCFGMEAHALIVLQPWANVFGAGQLTAEQARGKG
jgi:hypothetical protein